MTQVRYFDCNCEDYPCCGHYDTLYGDENEPQQCDMCGGFHRFDMPCPDDYDEDDEVDDDDGLDEPLESFGLGYDTPISDAFYGG